MAREVDPAGRDGLRAAAQGERAPLTNEFLPGEGLDQGTSGLE